MDATWCHYYSAVRKLSSLTGLWPYLQTRTKRFRIALLTVVTITIAVPQVAHHFMCQNLQCIFQTMSSYSLSIAALVKIYTFHLNQRTMKELTDRLFGHWKQLESTEEYEIMKLYAEDGRRYLLIYKAYAFSAVFLFMSMSLVPHTLDVLLPLNESRPILLTYPGYYFVDYREYFVYIYCHSIVAWEILLAGVIAHDCMFVAYVEHVCSIFAVIGFRFEHLLYNDSDASEATSDQSDRIYRERIAFSIRTHWQALEYAQLLENVFDKPFAIQIVIVTLMISVTFLQVTLGLDDIMDVIRYVLYVNGQLIHLFFLSFEGQKLMDHSVGLRDKVYNSSWYKIPVKSQKLLTMMMTRSVRSSTLTAGRIYILSLDSFTTVLQTSMSYFTVLASIQ